jgi:ASC-1-like (ASCH) protein
MHHIAIMKKSWNLTEKILDGRKTIESRWYLKKYAPWNRISRDDTIYFKDSGSKVTLKADVKKILQFENLTPLKVKGLLYKYGKEDGIKKSDITEYYERFKDKKYCLLIFLKNVQKVTPFEINKKGFGAMSAWISVENVQRIKSSVYNK